VAAARGFTAAYAPCSHSCCMQSSLSSRHTDGWRCVSRKAAAVTCRMSYHLTQLLGLRGCAADGRRTHAHNMTRSRGLLQGGTCAHRPCSNEQEKNWAACNTASRCVRESEATGGGNCSCCAVNGSGAKRCARTRTHTRVGSRGPPVKWAVAGPWTCE
jgi:hypothetical protein